MAANSNCHFPRSQRSGKVGLRQSQAGQIVIEYILLLAIAVAMAVLITKTLIGRDPGNEGFVLAAWSELLVQIGADTADDVKRPAAGP